MKNKRSIYQRFFKRFFDICISLFAIIVLSPVFLAVFIASKICLGGKSILNQYRPGKGGKLFKLHKFRSMTNETDQNGKLLPDEKRITKFGKFIRKTSLDELPQLFNILKGDMSLVGPRPRLVKDMIFYREDVLSAYNVRPGLTGLGQVMGGRSNASWESIFEYDAKYAQKITFFGDLKILFKTFLAVFKSEGAAAGAGKTKREYYYCDYLLKNNLITKQQYAMGLDIAQDLINDVGVVSFQPSLQPARSDK